MKVSGESLARLAALVTATAFGAALSQPLGVQVSVYGIHYGGQVVYRYQVNNGSASPIGAVTIGSRRPARRRLIFLGRD